MSHVFATAYNIKKTLAFTKTDNAQISSVIISDTILMRNLHLSGINLIKLKTLHIFLENPGEFISNYFKGWEDTVQFLIEEPPAYHTNQNCTWFKKDFYNIEIPSKIKDKNLIKEARQWAKSKQDLITPKTIDKFSILFMEHFNSKFNVGLTQEDLKSIERPNSGQQIVNSKLENIELEIRKILEIVNQKFTKKEQLFFDKEYKEKNYKYNGEYKKNGAYIEHKLSWDLYFWKYSIVKPLNRNIEDFFFLKLNEDHKYDQNVLNFLKFKPCQARDCN